MKGPLHITFVTTQLPYPPISGGAIKSWRLLLHFAQNHPVTLVCALKGSDSDGLDEMQSKIQLAALHAFPIDRPRNAINLLKSYLYADTLNTYRNRSRSIAEAINDSLPNCDVLLIDHYEMGQYIPTGFRGKVVLHQHNAEYVMWQRLGKLEKNPFKKILLYLESQRIAKAERAYCERADLVWAAPNDITELEKIGVRRSRMKPTYHLGEDEMMGWPDMVWTDTRAALFYAGTLSWEANVDGLLWFLEKVWPVVSSRHPDLVFDIAGKQPDLRLIEAASRDPRIQLHGFVEDLSELYRTSRVFVCPLRFGSGIKVKVINALYRGIPTVTSRIGVEGLDVADGVHLFFEDDSSEAFAKRVLVLLEDRPTWEKMSQNARMKGRNYTWKALLAQHDEDLQSLFNPLPS